MKTIELNNLNEIKKYLYYYNLNIIILFYGTRCKPCLKLKPLLKEKLDSLKEECLENTIMIKIDYAADPDINEYFGLKHVPFIILYKNKEKVFDIQSSKIDLVFPNIIEKLKIKEEYKFDITDDF